MTERATSVEGPAMRDIFHSQRSKLLLDRLGQERRAPDPGIDIMNGKE